MRSRRFVAGVVLPMLLMSVLLVVSACAPIPALPAPTAVAPTTAPVTEVAPFTATAPPPATEPLTPTLVAPDANATVTATVVITDVSPVLPTVTAPITPAATVEAGATVTATMAAPSWVAATYRDEVGGWEIDYPDGWVLTDVDAQIKRNSLGYSVTLTSWQPQEPGTQGIPEGGSKLDISVNRDGAESVEAAVEARRAEVSAGDAGSEIVFEEPWDLASGLSGVHWTIQTMNGETVHEFVAAINGNRLAVSGYGDELIFEQIVSTLRPLVAEGQATKQLLAPMVASGANEAAAAVAPQAATVYTVRQGDTLAKIAARFGVSVNAILAANPQITNPDRIFVGQRITIPGAGGNPPPPPPGTTRVNIYMIGIGSGSVGCGDEVVAVRRDVPRTNAPLTAALNLLLSQKSQYYGESGLYNALYQSDLRIGSITRSGSAWTINLTGTLRLGGVCDSPRVKAQLEQTARQFSTVGSVRYFINGQPLDAVLSGR
jgi:LysM repeat protein